MKIHAKRVILGICVVLAAASVFSGCREVRDAEVSEVTTDSIVTEDGVGETVPATVEQTEDGGGVPEGPREHIVDSFEALSALGYNGELRDGDSIRVTGSFEIDEPVRLYRAVSFIIEGTLNCRSYIEIENYTRCDCLVEVKDGVDVKGLDLRYDMPKCSLTWTGESPYDEKRLSEVMNVELYNQTDLREKYGLGGISWKKVTEVKASCKNNPSLSEDIYWTIDGNIIYLNAGDIGMKSLPDNLVLSIKLIDGLVNTEELDISEDVIYTVKDCTYDTRSYKIITDRALFINEEK